MKIKHGAWSGSIRTALGDLTFHTEKNYVIIARKKPIPTQPRTRDQLIVREAFRVVAGLWRSLSLENIYLWKEAFFRFRFIHKDYLNDTSGKVIPGLLVLPFSEKDLFFSLNLRAEIYNSKIPPTAPRYELITIPPVEWLAQPFIAELKFLTPVDSSPGHYITWSGILYEGYVGIYWKWRYTKKLIAVVSASANSYFIERFLAEAPPGNSYFQLLFVEQTTLTYSLSNLLIYRK